MSNNFSPQTSEQNPLRGIPVGESTQSLVIGKIQKTVNNNFVNPLGEQSPVDGVSVGARSTPTLIDFDGDGDLDLFVGNEAGAISFLENVGGPARANFVERRGKANPFDGVVIAEKRSNPTLADLDGDGQIDTAVVGNLAGTLSYFSYEGDRFVEQTGTANPFDGITLETRTAPTFVDLNGDGGLDLVVGDGQGTLSFFRNDGGEFTQQTGSDNPFEGIDVVDNSTPAFADIDGDGDVDAFVGDFSGGLVNYFENTGTATAAQFEARQGDDNPFGATNLSGPVPALGDLDGDGDIDAIVGGADGDLTYFVNSPSVSIAADHRTPSEDGAGSAFIVTSSQPAPDGGLTVTYTVEPTQYAAVAGVDYKPLTGQVTIAAGETTAAIDIQPLDNDIVDPLKTITVLLSPPEGYVVSAFESAASVAIADNEGDARLAQILNEPNFKDQWYLWNTFYNRGTPEVDLNVLEVWKDYSGKGINVGIIDDGVDADHPDLAANYNSAPNPDEERFGNHGTAVAGIVAAVVGNGEGGAGVAHGAKLTSYAVLFNRYDPEAVQTFVDAFQAQSAMDVSNNSWGDSTFSSDFRADYYIEYRKAIQAAAKNGRNGLGTVFVFSSMNERQNNDGANYSNLVNSRYTIGVAALTADGVHTSYSNPGYSLLISAFGSEGGAVFTTDIEGEEGYNTLGDYTFAFSGTSAAAPMVSGIAALILEANPNLGYRDVQEILAYSAAWNDADNASWTLNKANNWNGGGLRHSSDYGFGQVDALAAVRLAETWQTQHTAANEQSVSITSAAALAIPDAESSGIQYCSDK